MKTHRITIEVDVKSVDRTAAEEVASNLEESIGQMDGAIQDVEIELYNTEVELIDDGA